MHGRHLSTSSSLIPGGNRFLTPPDEPGVPSGTTPEDRELVLSAAESRATLGALAGHRLDPVPKELLIEHVLRIHDGDGWPIQRAAFEAVLRRATLAIDEELRASRRAPGSGEGTFMTRRAGAGALPWETAVRSLEPLMASCDCPDFLHNALGFCPHVYAAMSYLCSHPRVHGRIERRLAETAPRLDWDPVRPLHGADEAWQRLRYRAGGPTPAFARDWRERTGGWRMPTPGRARRDHVVRAAARYADRAPARVAPAARAVIAEELARLEREVSGRQQAHIVDGLRSMGRALYPYQREGVRRLVETGRLLLADDMGLGKTAQAIGACHALYCAGQVRRGIIVVPAALKGQWLREWRSFTTHPITMVEGPPATRRACYETTDDGFLLINYELLLRDRDALARWGADMVVLDEAQRIKNPSTKTARAVKGLRPRYRLALTGTPIENRLGELASILDWVDERALAPGWRLTPVHGGVGRVERLDTVRARMASCFLRRRREEILTQLPPRTDSFLPVEMTSAQLELHRQHERKVAQLISLRKRRPLRPAEELELIKHLTQQRIVANGIAQRDFETVWPTLRTASPDAECLAKLESPKLAAFREVIESLVVEQGRTIVVFSQWRRMLRLAWWASHDLLEAAGLRAVFFTGAESSKARERSIVELHDDSATKVLFSTDAGGVGLNLQRAASACVHLEPAWNPAVTQQRVARIHRLGQGTPIDVVHLVAPRSIEARIAKLSSAKRVLFDTLFDTEEDAVELDASSWLEDLMDEQLEGPSDDVLPHEPSGDEGSEAPPRGELEREAPERDREPDRVSASASCLGAGCAAATTSEPRGKQAGRCTPTAVTTAAVTTAAVTTAAAATPGTAVTPADPSQEARPEPPPTGGENAEAARSERPDSVIEEMFSALSVERSQDGSITISAPRSVAADLSAIFAGMASLIAARAA